MPATLANGAVLAHHETLQDRLRPGHAPMAKADLKKVQKAAIWQDDAAICAHAIALSRLSRKEAAARLGLSEPQLSAQLNAAERPQAELFRADDVMRGHYLIAQAMRYPDLFDVVTTISVRRIA